MKDVDIMIFGAERCGKTTLSRMLTERFGYPVIHMDAIYSALQEVYSIGSPTNGTVDGRNFFVQRYLRGCKHNGRFVKRYILEGHVEPLDLHYFFRPELNLIYFLGVTELDAAEMFKAIRKNDTREDWTTERTDEEVRKIAASTVALSKKYKALCEKQRIPFIETSRDRGAVLSSVMDEIETKLRQIDSEP